MKDDTKETILRWYSRAQLDYTDQYINLFISYSAWFKKVTKSAVDRDAINALKERTGIWNEYLDGKSMQSLQPLMEKIVTLTSSRPLINLTRENDPHWSGIVKDPNDWKSLIEFWYRVRCNLFHGSKSPEDERDSNVIYLAYQSLNIFMTEIIERMNNNFTSDDLDRLYEISMIKEPNKLDGTDFGSVLHSNYWLKSQLEKEEIVDRFKNAKNLWDIDL